jgi:hypothetical protein
MLEPVPSLARAVGAALNQTYGNSGFQNLGKIGARLEDSTLSSVLLSKEVV